MPRRAASGTGTIRKKTVTRKGKPYTYWEARVTVGRDPGTGRQIQRSFTGQTQAEVARKLTAAVAALDEGTYKAPCKLTVGEWLDIWARDYLGGVKKKTAASYQQRIDLYLRPALGAVKLDALSAHTIQRLYNGLSLGLSPRSVHVVHAVLHHALQQAVKLGYLRFNPADACTLPRIEKTELRPLDEAETKAFLQAIKGHRLEALFTLALFTGMRKSEIVGLTWDAVDFKSGVITVNKQLQRLPGAEEYTLQSPKSGKGRTVAPAPWIMSMLKRHRTEQAKQRLKAGELWEDGGFVFTDAIGHYIPPYTAYSQFKRMAASIGRPDARFHDLRHSYAVAALRAGDDIKTIQGNLGHATAAFTLDVYGHVTEQMKRDSAQHMEQYITGVLGL
ncbi:tyrosine-type recombinase/integrase [Vermiculatibacterium agrestimuris]|uniref:tyrosine-type recombinase/integrase n=1 Tax=Vermiculatibacterium agrestimuris TaxID=2941519 RepID=UPI00203D7CCB|nr:site-specific integrase [Vermiculatibacterium agrestimuris]